MHNPNLAKIILANFLRDRALIAPPCQGITETERSLVSSALKTRMQIRQEFSRIGMPYSAWAKQRGYSPNLVTDIINDDDKNPKRKCLRGDSHNIAVELGIKEGEINRSLAAA